LTAHRPAARRAGLRRALLDAARARRQEALAAGFLHDLNGPLNNVNLTLALLDTTLGRARVAAPGDSLLDRCQRHVALLQAESLRLQQWSRTVGSVLITPEASEPRADLLVLLGEVHRMVRHQAALHEVMLSVAAPEGVMVAIDPWHLRLLLLDVLAPLLELAAPGTTIAATADASRMQDGVALARLRLDGEPAIAGDATAVLEAAVAFDPERDADLPSPRSADGRALAEVVADLVAARVRAEALGARITLAERDGRVRIAVDLPLASHL